MVLPNSYQRYLSRQYLMTDNWSRQRLDKLQVIMTLKFCYGVYVTLKIEYLLTPEIQSLMDFLAFSVKISTSPLSINVIESSGILPSCQIWLKVFLAAFLRFPSLMNITCNRVLFVIYVYIK